MLLTKSYSISKRKAICQNTRYYYKGLLESVVVIIFQNVFHAEMHQNDVFLFFKNYF
jgi:hypothetical protein